MHHLAAEIHALSRTLDNQRTAEQRLRDENSHLQSLNHRMTSQLALQEQLFKAEYGRMQTEFQDELSKHHAEQSTKVSDSEARSSHLSLQNQALMLDLQQAHHTLANKDRVIGQLEARLDSLNAEVMLHFSNEVM